MGRASTKKDKNMFQTAREKCGLTREAASDLFAEKGWQDVSPDRIERIESGKIDNPHPYDVLAMSEVYGEPLLCNYYCTQRCKIGEKYSREVKSGELPQIAVNVLSALSALNEERDRLLAISADGRVNDWEIEDFIRIQKELEDLSVTVETLRFWTEQMLAENKIDKKKYNALKNKA